MKMSFPKFSKVYTKDVGKLKKTFYHLVNNKIIIHLIFKKYKYFTGLLWYKFSLPPFPGTRGLRKKFNEHCLRISERLNFGSGYLDV